jgi:hypothetical protein
VVGNIQIDKLATLGEKLNIDPLKDVGKALQKQSENEPAAEAEE